MAHTHLGGGSARQEVGSQAEQAAAAAAALPAQHACAWTTWSHSGQDSSIEPGAHTVCQHMRTSCSDMTYGPQTKLPVRPCMSNTEGHV